MRVGITGKYNMDLDQPGPLFYFLDGQFCKDLYFKIRNTAGINTNNYAGQSF